MIYLHNNFHVPFFNFSLIVVIKGKAKEIVTTAGRHVLIYILFVTNDFVLNISVTACGVLSVLDD